MGNASAAGHIMNILFHKQIGLANFLPMGKIRRLLNLWEMHSAHAPKPAAAKAKRAEILISNFFKTFKQHVKGLCVI